MRTKALLCAAGLLAAGAFTAMAQSNVYSLNVVGYVNVSLTNGFTLLANQLDLDGNLTNNTVVGIFSTNFPTLTQVITFNPSSGGYATATFLANGTWSGGGAGNAAVNVGLRPGAGVWVHIPDPTGTPTP